MISMISKKTYHKKELKSFKKKEFSVKKVFLLETSILLEKMIKIKKVIVMRVMTHRIAIMKWPLKIIRDKIKI